ncbi:RTC4 [[Candida] subhashii]|uniref:Restriction of telomere capping protein 4 n=1 Tax=[Candida] subhashii TaxID=561895 RepID=A0A8J5Q4H1_9ASCO|nr:RTC4 [[Candida] subhashii]KAG7661499.1 RTC4 [[Candida] subhashii]
MDLSNKPYGSLTRTRKSQNSAPTIPVLSSPPNKSDSEVIVDSMFTPEKKKSPKKRPRTYGKGKPYIYPGPNSTAASSSDSDPLDTNAVKASRRLQNVIEISDDEFEIIDVKKIKGNIDVGSKFAHIRKNIDDSQSAKRKEMEEEFKRALPDLDAFEGGLASEIDSKNILHSLELQNEKKVEPTKKKFQSYHIPETITSQKELLGRAETYFPIIPKLVDGELKVSSYYQQARIQRKKSQRDVMGADENWSIDWEQYFAGYYGFKRQSIIGGQIAKKFRNRLLNCDSDTVAYWTVSKFCTYVLANEIIIRMVMDDKRVPNKHYTVQEERELRQAAERTMRETVEYGTIVADSIEVKNDLDFPEDKKKVKTDKKEKKKVRTEVDKQVGKKAGKKIEKDSSKKRTHTDVISIDSDDDVQDGIMDLIYNIKSQK